MALFSSDHGDYTGNHGLIRKDASFYDEVLRVTMLVRSPGCRAASVYDQPTQHEGLAATNPLELKNLYNQEHLRGQRKALENELLEWLVQIRPWLSPKTHGY